jgi:hypothetical protein|tara:strand:+ start:3700 stop:4074 length:375 start_codon:yes stop_codon:yes gene_type:complete
MSSEGDNNTAEQLMGVLISKMESMDYDLVTLKKENIELRRAVGNPSALLRKAGFVRSRNSMPSGILPDEFRNESNDMLMKGADGIEIHIPETNADFHNTEWADIHALADRAKSTGAIGNQVGME